MMQLRLAPSLLHFRTFPFTQWVQAVVCVFARTFESVLTPGNCSLLLQFYLETFSEWIPFAAFFLELREKDWAKVIQLVPCLREV